MIPSIMCNVFAAVVVLMVAVAPTRVASFQLHPSTQTIGRAMTTNNALRPLTFLHSDSNQGSDTPKEEEVVGDQYEGSVDWDAEWKKVVENQDQPSQRPGNYKTPVELQAIKTTNKVAKNVYDASKEMQSKMPSAPSIRSMQGDWRFWIGIIVIVSFGLSILTATTSAPVNDSFYI